MCVPKAKYMGLNLAVSSKAEVSCIMANCADPADVKAVTDNHNNKEDF